MFPYLTYLSPHSTHHLKSQFIYRASLKNLQFTRYKASLSNLHQSTHLSTLFLLILGLFPPILRPTILQESGYDELRRALYYSSSYIGFSEADCFICH